MKLSCINYTVFLEFVSLAPSAKYQPVARAIFNHVNMLTEGGEFWHTLTQPKGPLCWAVTLLAGYRVSAVPVDVLMPSTVK